MGVLERNPMALVGDAAIARVGEVGDGVEGPPREELPDDAFRLPDTSNMDFHFRAGDSVVPNDLLPARDLKGPSCSEAGYEKYRGRVNGDNFNNNFKTPRSECFLYVTKSLKSSL